MHRLIAFVALVLPSLLSAPLAAQSNTVPGLDGRLIDVNEITYWGRRGSAFPNGEVGMSWLNTMCNPGTVQIPWYAAMASDHPKFGFIMTRESNGRMVQISDWSYCKHAFTCTNGQGSCGNCVNPGTGAVMGLHCVDTYGAGNNGDRYWLGPPSEIDPWLGTWNPVGSYFDRGDPPVSGPAAMDGQRSLTSQQVAAFDAVKNLVTIKEQDLLVPGANYYYAIQLIHQGEAAANRGDNIASRGLSVSGTASGWTVNNNSVGMVYGSILQHWNGATLDSARNGNDDGTFYVAVVVTGPVNGLYHYEYAVHNVDNSRGGAGFHVPMCSSAVVSNFGFKDIDGDPLDDWTASRVGNELIWSATANNPQNWNTVYNFWFDATVAPANGQVQIDEARMGAGALSVMVNARIPAGVPQVVALGPGCGSPAPQLAVIGTPVIPNNSFELGVQTTPGAGLLVLAAFGRANLPWGNGCVQYLDNASLMNWGFAQASILGFAAVPMPIPNSPLLEGVIIDWQVAQLQAGGPVLGMVSLSNGCEIVIGNNVRCQ